MKKRLYDQVRFIDKNGYEEVRVNFYRGLAKIISQHFLQNKKHRYYFEDSITLSKGQIFISPFDLNIEHGEIEKPIKPMIRFSTPIYFNNKKEGIIVLNYLGDKLLTELEKNLKEKISEFFFMLNSDGYFLKGKKSTEEWGFMYKNDETFEKYFSKEFLLIKDKHEGQIYTNKGLFTFYKIFPTQIADNYMKNFIQEVKTPSDEKYYWNIITYLPQAALNNIFDKKFNKYFIISILALISITFITITIVILLIRRREILENLKELNEKKSTFVANVSHEFKNPLTVIIGATKFLIDEMKDSLSPDQKELLESCYNSSNRLNRLVSNLLDVSKIEAGKIQLEKEDFEIRPFINEIIENFKQTLNKKENIVDLNIDENVTTINADKDKLTEIFINLISNAIKYSPKNEKIILSAKKDKKNIVFSIEDKGKGLSQENIAKIFDKFERIKEDKKEGTGLGLSIAKDLINLHLGKIIVESEIGKGSKFIFTLPINNF